MTADRRVVLASASPRRRELLAALIPSYGVDAADILEELSGDPVANAVRLAKEKASAVQAKLGPGFAVIGADTIVFDGLRSYGKPGDAGEAATMLRDLRGRTHSVVTAVALVTKSGAAASAAVAQVTMAGMTDETIDAYVASGRPLDKAGAYAIQDDDVPTVAGLTGCYCTVMGLPLWDLRRLLLAEGLHASAPDATYARCAACPSRE